MLIFQYNVAGGRQYNQVVTCSIQPLLKWKGITAHINGVRVCLCAAGVVSVVVRDDDFGGGAVVCAVKHLL